jgi:nicotinamide-nucleotide amidase
MKIGLITIGAELLNGTRIDTNAGWIGHEVISSGGKVLWHATISDTENDIVEALNNVPKSIDIIICTGGLGPTHDDITLSVLFDYFKVKAEFDSDYWELLTNKFLQRDLKIPDINKNQAMKPSIGNIIPNPIGSARGLHLKNNSFDLFALPGVPSEMKAMMNEYVLPWIQEKSNITYNVKLLRTTGIMESALYEKLESFINDHQKIEVAFLPKLTGVDIRISSNSKNINTSFVNKINPIINKYYYGELDIELEDVVAKLLLSSNMTVSTAESCTGGLVSDRLTNVSGSSKYFNGGVVAYSNEIKSSVLNLNKDIINSHGAVSDEVAMEMARGVKEKFSSDIGISTTGIAGPSGGTKSKSVGLVYVAISTDKFEKTYKFSFTPYRKANKLMTSQAALNIIRFFLLKGLRDS